MASLLNLERFAQSGAAVPPAPGPAFPSSPELAQAPAIIEEYDYEIVLDRGQFAGIGLMAIVLVAVFSGVSYLIGRSMSSTAAAAAASHASAAPAPVVPSPVVPAAPVVEVPAAKPASPTPQAVAEPTSDAPAAPLFADAVAGKVYLQVGAIEKGLAGIWAEGLRAHGLDAFVAPGPGDKQWRVLVGPMPDPQTFQRTKDTLDKLGVSTFGRKYQP
jgi:cell division septation protein DedD